MKENPRRSQHFLPGTVFDLSHFGDLSSFSALLHHSREQSHKKASKHRRLSNPAIF
jgi:hypothetical protein